MKCVTMQHPTVQHENEVEAPVIKMMNAMVLKNERLLHLPNDKPVKI